MAPVNPKIYRKRYKPQEVIHLKDDIILYNDDEILITKWTVLKPRKDISGGRSCYFLNKNYKISEIFDNNNRFLFWYCDIIETVYNSTKNEYIFIDLLLDVIVYKDKYVKAVDLADLADALENNLVSVSQTLQALRAMDELLTIVYRGDFEQICKVFEKSCIN